MVKEGQSELRALGDAIRARRAELGMSQEDFAALCDLHRTYIGQVERGEKNVSFVNLLRVSKGFRVKVSELYEMAGL